MQRIAFITDFCQHKHNRQQLYTIKFLLFTFGLINIGCLSMLLYYRNLVSFQ